MGGGAFTRAYAPNEATLRTPRMNGEEYKRLREASIARLRCLLPGCTVAALVEAPEKEDYGDIDLVIATDGDIELTEVANHLHAAGIIIHNSKKATLAVAKNVVSHAGPAVIYRHWYGNGSPPATSTSIEEYAQLDIDVISPTMLDWHLFYSSYGDLAGLVGHIVTQLGFTMSESGFWLRLIELDASKDATFVNVPDRDGFILLSRDARRVMGFLGCSEETYEAGLTTVDQLYEWLGSCRLLSADAVKMKRNNSHERNREQKRGVYARFFTEWLPAHMDMHSCEDKQGRTDAIRQLRERFLEEALDFFSVRGEYESKRAGIVLTMDNGLAADMVKRLVAQDSGKAGKSLNEIVRAFRRHVRFDEAGEACMVEGGHGDAASELHRFLRPDRSGLEDWAREWVRVHWHEVRELERKGKGWHVGTCPTGSA